MIRLLTTLLFLTFGCGPSGPDFDEDHAFEYLVAQCDFGPRNPGSEGYYACLDFIINELDQSADDIILQDFRYQEQRYRKRYDLQNIIARFNPDASFQTIISAHWDTRPWADQEDNRRDRNQPIIGANDGASGVAVLLELAKIMGETPPPIGVNLVFFDGEDLGVPGENETYCQGSRYFAKNLPITLPDYAINLDMVGDANLEIYIERISYKQNPSLVLELWGLAEELKLSGFKKMAYHSIFDDHVPLYELAGIPAVDIIDFDYPDEKTNYHHTYNDIVENCSPESLRQVGTLMVHHIYNQQ